MRNLRLDRGSSRRGHGGDEPGPAPSRPGRGGAPGRRGERRGARVPPPEHHRPQRRPPAADQRGRHGLGRLQRRDLQPSRAARATACRGPHASRALRHGGARPISTRSTASIWFTRSRGCTPSRSGTPASGGCCSPATASGRSRSSTPRTPALTFASELTGLRTGLGSTPDLDPAALDAFFVFGYVPGPASMLQGVRQLPPGHMLRGTWDRAREGVALLAPAAGATASGESVEELAAEAGRLLDASIRGRLLADVPLGVFLSGGVDSTLIAALAARVSRAGQDLHGRLRRRPRDERAEARAAAELLGTEHRELTLTGADAAPACPRCWRPRPAACRPGARPSARHRRVRAAGCHRGDRRRGGRRALRRLPRYRWLRRAPQALPGRSPPAAS